MHECFACGQACDCDGEDTWNDDNWESCQCGCHESQGWDDDGESPPEDDDFEMQDYLERSDVQWGWAP